MAPIGDRFAHGTLVWLPITAPNGSGVGAPHGRSHRVKRCVDRPISDCLVNPIRCWIVEIGKEQAEAPPLIEQELTDRRGCRTRVAMSPVFRWGVHRADPNAIRRRTAPAGNTSGTVIFPDGKSALETGQPGIDRSGGLTRHRTFSERLFHKRDIPFDEQFPASIVARRRYPETPVTGITSSSW